MKQYFFLLFLSVFLLGCEDDVEPPSSLADDLQAVIDQRGVTHLSTCCVGCQCEGSGTRDFSFPGDNTLRITTTYYNLGQLLHFSIWDSSEGTQMRLYFQR